MLPNSIQRELAAVARDLYARPWSSAQLLLDSARKSAPAPDAEVSPSRVPEFVGPWRLIGDGDKSFVWSPTPSPTLQERLKFHLARHETGRKHPEDGRVILIGESAAASWGYFGDYCLSAALQTSLSSLAKHPVEVIDLTCVNASWRRECTALLKAGMTLDPDLVIVFCGNNEARWLLPSHHANESPDGPFSYASRWAVQTCDLAETISALHAEYHDGLRRAATTTISTCRGFGKKLIFVIPAFNYGDWIPNELVPSGLSGESLGAWFRLVDAAELSLDAGDVAEALRQFEAACVLDGWTCQRSHFGLARAMRTAASPSARQHFEDGLGAGLGPFFQAVPMLPEHGANVIRQSCSAFDVPYVDLPNLLASAAVDHVPGREYFLDYCHLSAKGHNLLISALADVISTNRMLPNVNYDCAHVPRNLPLSAVEQSLACICSALHSHQNGQPESLVRYWLEASIAASTETNSLLQILLETACLRWRDHLTLEVMEAKGLRDAPERFKIFFLKFIYHARFDDVLFRLLCEVLRISPQDRKTRFTEQTAGMLPTLEYSLKSLFFLDRRSGCGQFVREMSRSGWEQPGIDFLFYLPKAEICFPWDDGVEGQIELSISPPWKGESVAFSLFINGHNAGSFVVDAAYTELIINLRSSLIPHSLNRIRIDFEQLHSVRNIQDRDARASYITMYGPYPVVCVLHAMKINPCTTG
ncbi:MAG TPA: hypothetical protein VF624_19490 [Tepidisphaeraceae bacterium]|jgi:hypothetical protein